MQAAQAWAAYSAAIIGYPLENIEEKFDSLSEAEQLAWFSVAVLALGNRPESEPEPVASLEVLEVPAELPEVREY
jgi:hypothetical protein